MSRQTTAEPTTSTPSMTTMGTTPDGVLAAVTTLMTSGHVPGLSLAVVDRDRLLLSAGFGAADLASTTPATPSTAYLWFSMSKLVTATAALRLAEDGRLDMDAPVGEYVDYLRAPGPRQPTVRQLLNHTSGLANPLPIRWAHLADATPPDPGALLRRLMSRRRAYRYPVGAAARYTNLGYLAAGQVITTAAGQPLQTYVQQSVLDPVGMTRTGFTYQPDADAATGYVRSPKVADPVLRRILPAGVAGSRHGGYLALNRFHVDGPAYGGLAGDVLDAGRFLRMHLGDGQIDGHRVLKPETTRAMRRLDQKGKPFDHGLGWFRRPATGRGDWVEHFGAGAGFWNVIRLYPDRGLGVVVMTNSTTTYDFEPLFALLAGASWS
jgi:CubicO group peptidase (beta-lactamase class C family)